MSTETSSGRCPPFFSQLASLPEVVVLPEPCRPAIRTTVGGCEANFSLAVSLPRVSTSSSRRILMTCSPGESAVITCCPTDSARMRSMRSLTTLKLTSASSSARRICFSASSIFSSVRTACPRKVLKARWSFSWRFSNIKAKGYFSSRDAVARECSMFQGCLLFKDLVKLDEGFNVGIVRNVCQDFGAVFGKRSLKFLNGIDVDRRQANERGRRTGYRGQPSANLNAVSNQTSYPRNVLFCVVLEIEISAVPVRIEHGYTLHTLVLLRSRHILSSYWPISERGGPVLPRPSTSFAATTVLQWIDTVSSTLRA